MSEAQTTSTSTEPIAINGGDNALFFDELVNISEESEVSKSEKKAAKAEKESKEAQNPKGKEKDLVNTDDKSKAEKPKEAGKKEAKESVEKTEAEKEAIKRKAYKAKYADQEHELDEDLEFEHPVNGQPTKVKLKELLSDFSGRKNWNQEFQNISKDRKEVQGVKKSLEEANTKIKNVFEEKDPQLRIFKMAEMAGVSPLDFRNKFLADNMKLLEKWSVMSDDEKKADALQFENNYLKYQTSTKAENDAKRQAFEQHQAKVQKLLTSAQITPDEYEAQEDFLKDLYTKQGKNLAELTPEKVVEVNQKNKLWDSAQAVFEKLQHKMSTDAMIDFIDKAHFQGLTPADMADVIDQIYGKTKAKEVIEEKQKQSQEFKTGTKPSYQKQAPQNDGPMFFDDL